MSDKTEKNDDLNERVNQAIRAQLLALMPEDELRTRVDSVMVDFFREKKNGNIGYSSPFADIVNNEMRKRVQPAIEELFRSEKWKLVIDEKGDIVLGEALAKIVGWDPTIIPEWAAKQAHLNMAKSIVMLLVEFAHRNNNYDYANALQNFMQEEIKRLG